MSEGSCGCSVSIIGGRTDAIDKKCQLRSGLTLNEVIVVKEAAKQWRVGGKHN